MRHKLLFMSFLTFILFNPSYVIKAQYRLGGSVFGYGGNILISGQNQIMCTVGQPSIGTTVGGSDMISLGFWFGQGGPATGIIRPQVLALTYKLGQNFPNPFNPVTNITFCVPERTFTSLKVFDVIGREVASIVSEELAAGNYTRQWNASDMPSGVYFYRLIAGSFNQTRKFILLK